MKSFILMFTTIMLLFIILVSGLTPIHVLADTWYGGYAYRTPIVITGSSGAGANYTILINVHSGVGVDSGNTVYLDNHAEDFPNDVRFTDNDMVTPLSQWLESYEKYSYNSADSVAKYWVKVSDNLDSDQTIYMYYGKAADTLSSNDNSTFIMGADFDDGTTTGLTVNVAGTGSLTVENPTEILSTLKVDYFHKMYSNPVIAVGGNGTWDDSGVRDLGIVRDANNRIYINGSGQMEAYYYGMDTTDETTHARKIGRATSTDGGKTWTKYGSNPVFSGSGGVGDWDRYGAQAPSVMYLPSTGPDIAKPYKMIYGGRPDMLSPGEIDIGLAESADGITWTRYASNPLLTIANFTNVRLITVPYLIKNSAGTYVMIMEAYTNASHALGDTKWIVVGATSSNLTSWTVMNSGNNILSWGAGGSWDAGAVANPKIIELTGADAGKYILGYNGATGTGNAWSIGFASTTDAPTSWTTASWTKYASNPVISPSNITGRYDRYHTEMSAMTIDDIETGSSNFRVWFQAFSGALGTLPQICLAEVPQGRIYHGVSTTAAGAYLAGYDMDSVTNFMSEIIVGDNFRNTPVNDSTAKVLALYDYAAVPSPGTNVSFNPNERLTIARYPLPDGSIANGSKFDILYIDGVGTGHWWTGSTWTTTPTSVGTQGIVKVKLYDDGTNYNVQILDAITGTSLLGTATIAKASVKAFSNGRVLFLGEQLTSHYAMGIDYDNWTLRKYVSTEPAPTPGTPAPGAPTQVLWYQPNTIIQSTTLPDRATSDGTQNGIISWGTNPSGITVTPGPFGPGVQGGHEAKAPPYALGGTGNFITDPPVLTGSFSNTTAGSSWWGLDIWRDVAATNSTPIQLILLIVSGFVILAISLTSSWIMKRFGSGTHFVKAGIIFGLMGMCTALSLYDWWMIVIFAVIAIALSWMSQQRGVT